MKRWKINYRATHTRLNQTIDAEKVDYTDNLITLKTDGLVVAVYNIEEIESVTFVRDVRGTKAPAEGIPFNALCSQCTCVIVYQEGDWCSGCAKKGIS